MISIRVPASTSNFGPGFDALGAALNIYNHFYLEESGEELVITGCDEKFANETNLVYSSMKYTADKYHKSLPKGIKLHIETKVPVSRGLGSSATCIVAGVIAAKELLKLPISTEDMVLTATEIEGHPDNVAPALLGGMIAGAFSGGKVYFERIPVSKGLKFAALIPDFTLSTALSRAVLPDTIERKDGVFNLGRASLLIASLVNGSFHNLSTACEDKLHQPYRASLIPGYEAISEKCHDLNAYAVFLSGAGPTIMVALPENNMDFIPSLEAYLKTLEHKWRVQELHMDLEGAKSQVTNLRWAPEI